MVRINLKKMTPPEELEFYPWDVMLKQGYHWMDKYGYAYWIPDMETSYLHNALRFARAASQAVASSWWNLAMSMNGEMAVDQAERYAMKYDEGDVPLVKGLVNEIARRQGTRPPYHEWELNEWGGISDYLENQGYAYMAYMDGIRALGTLVEVNEAGDPIYKEVTENKDQL